MRVHLCGVRGSTPAPGREFAGVGGHTSCVALATDDGPVSLILDAGTGIRTVSDLLDGEPFRGALILGHLHWDHVCGLPFFAAGDRPGAEVEVLVPEQGADPRDLIQRVMGPPFFPIDPTQLQGAWQFRSYDEGERTVGPFTVVAREIPHKGGRTMGLRVSDGRSTIAYLSDHAPHADGPGPEGFGAYHPAAMALVEGVDLLLHDAQYTAAELPARASYGHAAADYVRGLATAAGIGRALLFHHDPSRTDREVAQLAAAVGVEAAREGMRIDL